jgi:hypothetical protein
MTLGRRSETSFAGGERQGAFSDCFGSEEKRFTDVFCFEIRVQRENLGRGLPFAQVVAANYGCVDGGSGVASCVGTVANDVSIDTKTVGTKTFTVSTSDNVGNSSAPRRTRPSSAST